MAVAVAKPPRRRRVGFDRVAAFVDEPVVLVAEQDEVVEAGVATVGPVAAVVGGEMTLTVTTGPLAAAVTGFEQPS